MDEKTLKKAAAIVRAKRQIESGGDYSAYSQEAKKTGNINDGYGAYQYMGDTWKAAAGKYLGNPNADIRDKRNQDRVEMAKTLDQLKNGYTLAEIFSEHNTGSRTGWQSKVGTNKYGVKYNAPAYVQKGVNETIKQAQLIAGRSIAAGNQTASTQEQPMEEPEKKQTFLGKVARGIVKPFARLGANLLGAGKTLIGDNQGASEIATKGLDTSYLGNIKPVGSYGLKEYYQTGKKSVKSIGKDILETAGTGAEIASNIPLAGAGGAVVASGKAAIAQPLKQIAKGGVKQFIKTGLKNPILRDAALSGAMSSGGVALQEDKNLGGVLKNVATGAVVGAATSKLGSKIADRFLTKTVGGQPQVVNEVVEKLKQYSGQGKNVKKVIAKFEKSDAYNTLVKNYIKGVTVADNKITADLGIKNVLSDIANIDDEVTKRIKTDPTLFSEVSIISKLRNAIDGSGLVGTSKLKAKDYFTKETQNILKDYGVSGGKVSAEAVHSLRKYFDDMASKTFKINNGVVTPKEQAARAMADELRTIIRSNIKDKSVGDMLKAESKLLATKDLMETLNGRVVKGGRLGSYFAGATGAGIGALAGAPLGGVGAVVGGYIGKEVAEKLQAIVANGAIGTVIQRYKLDKISKNAISELLDAGKIDEAVAEALMKVAPAVKTPYDNAVVNIVTSPTFKKITANAILRGINK